MKRVDFTVEYNGCTAAVEGYLLGESFNGEARGPFPAVLICPGGGYAFVSTGKGSRSPCVATRRDSTLLCCVIRLHRRRNIPLRWCRRQKP